MTFALARLRDDPEAIPGYELVLEQIKEGFNQLRRNSSSRDEDYAIQAMQSAYGVIQLDIRSIFDDPFELNRIIRSKVLNPDYEDPVVESFESAFADFNTFINDQLDALQSEIDQWSKLAPWILPLPILLSVILLAVSRRRVNNDFMKPMRSTLDGAERMRIGVLDEQIPLTGARETAAIANSLNRMATELKESQDALIESERQAALGALVPVVAHNVRNPLASIRASAQMIGPDDEPSEVEETKDAIVSTVDRLERWVAALVSYLHPLKPNAISCPLADVVDAAVEMVKPRLVSSGVEIQRAPWDPETTVSVDPDLMEQAIYGVLSNALDVTPKNGILRVGIYRDANRVVLTITDQGPGMPFKPEPTSLSPGPSTKQFGTGLGIPIAYKSMQSAWLGPYLFGCQRRWDRGNDQRAEQFMIGLGRVTTDE